MDFTDYVLLRIVPGGIDNKPTSDYIRLECLKPPTEKKLSQLLTMRPN